METIHRDYAPRGVRFFYVYKSLAHPEHDGYVIPFTLEERLMHVREAQRTLGSQITWICDPMTNDLKHALGDAPNSEFVIDPQGHVVRRRLWSDPAQLRSDLEELVGEIDRPTTVDQLAMKQQPPPKLAARGVVPRLKVSSRMHALLAEAADTQTPFYAKLRAEGDEQLLRSGSGKLYLGFHLDPLYHVHWNNLAPALQFSVTAAPGVWVSPGSAEGPKVAEPADMDPREFLLDVQNWQADQPLEVQVDYFACNDEQGWCKPVSQRYTIRLTKDADGGWVMQRHRRP